MRRWFERYISVLHFLAGRMKDCVDYYERSLQIPADERLLLGRHSTEIYVAKALQMLGRREEAVGMIAAELQRLKSAGRYEELWLGYLFAAEIHYQNISIDNFNGEGKTFEAVVKYFALADEYAPLYRKTDTQREWAKMQRRIYSLMFPSEPTERAIEEIFENLNRVGDYFKTIALARLYHYFGVVGDWARAADCAKRCIEVGERTHMMMTATMAYGILARFAIGQSGTELPRAVELTRCFIRLCDENGMYEYFRMRKAYDPLLMFAAAQGIEPEITRRLMDFAGFKPCKAVVETLGGFSIRACAGERVPIKLRTRKERELFAFLLDTGEKGATKEQIGQALWYETESEDVKRLIGVNLAQLKRDLTDAGLQDAIVNVNRHYHIRRDELRVDIDEFTEAARAFEQTGSPEAARRLATIYKGEYLGEFEAFWAVGRRLQYAALHERALARLLPGREDRA